MSKLLMCLNTLDSKQLLLSLHQNGFEVTSTSDIPFALKLIDEGSFNLILIESSSKELEKFAEKIRKHPTLNALLISKEQTLPFCPYTKGFLGHIHLEDKTGLIFFLKNFFKQTAHAKLLTASSSTTKAFIVKSPLMLDILEKVKKIAKTQSSVLLTGESGTGKELIAHMIHEHSLRAEQPFVAINSCAISPQLLESELFGYEKGAFTGALSRKIGRLEFANHGTFFFDEIGEAPLELQAKLLRVIQERSFERVGGLEAIKLNIRFIAATNIDLEEATAQKKFREDLYYRLNVVPLHLPPLRERVEDILPLAEHFVKMHSEKNQSLPLSFTQEATDWLQSYNWPGNIRQLSNIIERACILAREQQIQLDDLIPHKKAEIHHEELDLASMEKKAIVQALLKTGGNKTQAAKLLGLSTKTLRAKLGS